MMNNINDRNLYILVVTNIRGKGFFVGQVATQYYIFFFPVFLFFCHSGYARVETLDYRQSRFALLFKYINTPPYTCTYICTYIMKSLFLLYFQ